MFSVKQSVLIYLLIVQQWCNTVVIVEELSQWVPCGMRSTQHSQLDDRVPYIPYHHRSDIVGALFNTSSNYNTVRNIMNSKKITRTVDIKERSVFVAVNHMPLEHVPVWTPFRCFFIVVCFSLFQR